MKSHTSVVSKLLALALFIFIGTSGFAQSLKQTAITRTVNSVIGGYYEALPLDYQTNTSKQYPLLIFVHGIGEIGNGSQSSLPAVLRNGPPKLIANGTFPATITSNGQTFSFIVISPQFNTQDRTGNSIQTLIDFLVRTYRVDQSRIYLTGLSMGGGMSWIYAGTKGYTQRLAALAPVCGNAKPYDTFINHMVEESLPVWAFHNNDDPTVTSQWTKDWIAQLNGHVPAISPAARGTIFNASGHDAWSRAYDPNYRENGKNVYEWLLSYSKGGVASSQPPANVAPSVNAGADKTITLPTATVSLGGSASDPDGSVSSYTWSKVSGPASASFSATNILAPVVSALVQGVYTFRLTVKDNLGASSYDDVNVTVNNGTVIISTGKSVKVKIYGGIVAYAATDWNNWNIGTGARSNVISPSFTYSDGTASTIKATLSQSAGVGDNGSTYVSGMAPAPVLRHASFSTVSRTLTISGLMPGKAYNLEFYASRSNNSGNNTNFIINGKTVSVSTYNNATNKASFSSVPASSGGTITVSLTRSNTYTYLNGFMISDASSLVTSNVAGSGIETMSATTATGLNVYPNPFTDKVIVTVDNQFTGQMNIAVYDLAGTIKKQVVMTKSSVGSMQAYLSLGDLATGNYIIKVVMPDWTNSVQVSKQ